MEPRLRASDMRRSVRFSRGRLRYTGRIARASFVRWAGSTEGQSALAPLASQRHFALFGRMRAARRHVWRLLARSARSEAVGVALQHEIDQFLCLHTLAYADLPCVRVDLRRLVVVPRLFVNSETYRRLSAALHAQPAFAALEGGESLRAWFALTLIEGVGAAVVRARPSPRRPLPAGEGWIAVGVNEQFEWHVPIESPAWPGHYYVLELRPTPITRAVRKATRQAITGLEASLLSLSRADRGAILRQATASLERLASA
jgi:hypothetical protein